MMQTKIDQISEDLYFITLIPPMKGFDEFIGVWLKTGKPSYLIDVGPTVTSRELLNTLNELGVAHLDYILITHIHIDHAGGIGNVSQAFPNTPIICHQKAINHLKDPAKLWQGSLKTLGDMARSYGEIGPVLTNPIIDAQDFKSDKIIAIITPGHAPHHVSFNTPFCLFAGETCGVHIELGQGKDYLRPATPPKFFLETSIKSIDLLIEQGPQRICFGHYGISDNAVGWLENHREQLILWKNIIGDEIKNIERTSFFADCINRLKKEDHRLANFDLLSPDKQERETYFITNSIKGYVGYLESTF